MELSFKMFIENTDMDFQGAHEIDGIRYDSKHGIGAVPDNQNVHYMGHIVMMTPKEFLNLNPVRTSDHSITYLHHAIADGQAIGPPFISARYSPEDKSWEVVP